jgi:hypothetical protein
MGRDQIRRGRLGIRRGNGPRIGGRNFDGENRGPRREIRKQFRGEGRFNRNFQSDRPARRFEGNNFRRGGSRFERGGSRLERGSSNFRGRREDGNNFRGRRDGGNFRGNGFRRSDRGGRGGRGGRFNNLSQKDRLDRQLDNMNKRNPDYMKKRLDDDLENYRNQEDSNVNQNKP